MELLSVCVSTPLCAFACRVYIYYTAYMILESYMCIRMCECVCATGINWLYLLVCPASGPKCLDAAHACARYHSKRASFQRGCPDRSTQNQMTTAPSHLWCAISAVTKLQRPDKHKRWKEHKNNRKILIKIWVDSGKMQQYQQSIAIHSQNNPNQFRTRVAHCGSLKWQGSWPSRGIIPLARRSQSTAWDQCTMTSNA